MKFSLSILTLLLTIAASSPIQTRAEAGEVSDPNSPDAPIPEPEALQGKSDQALAKIADQATEEAPTIKNWKLSVADLKDAAGYAKKPAPDA